jgi:hypothetical protein
VAGYSSTAIVSFAHNNVVIVAHQSPRKRRKVRNSMFDKYVVIVNKTAATVEPTEREKLRRARWEELVANCHPLVNVAAVVTHTPHLQRWLNGDDHTWDEAGFKVSKMPTSKESDR